jgi:hypothetical protein
MRTATKNVGKLSLESFAYWNLSIAHTSSNLLNSSELAITYILFKNMPMAAVYKAFWTRGSIYLKKNRRRF